MADVNHRPGEASPTTKLYKYERYMTVSSMSRGFEKRDLSAPSGYKRHMEVLVPFMRFSGKWLEAAGFEIHARVRIRIMAGCLVLTTE